MKTENTLDQGTIHQLRFLLFEIGLALSEKDIEKFLFLAEQQCRHELEKQNQPSIHPALMHRLISRQALSLAYQHQWQQQLKKQAGAEPRFWDSLKRQNDFRMLEQWASLGEHFVIPRFQHCRNHSLRELMLYEPQFQSQFRLHWCAFKKSIFGEQSQWEQQIQQAFPELYQGWQQQLRNLQLIPEHYFPSPVHPAHWRHQHFRSQAIYQPQDLLVFPHFQTVWAGLGQRIFPVQNEQYYLRFNAQPSLSGHLELNIEQHLKLNCRIEPHPQQRIKEGEMLLPVSALFVPSPMSQRPLFEDILADIQPAQQNDFRKFIQSCIKKRSRTNKANRQINYLVFNNGLPHRLLFNEDYPGFPKKNETVLKLKAC